MAKIPFDIKFKPQIESGEYKVETRDGRSVRIICWDRVAKENTDDDLNICVLVPEDNGEGVYYYHQSGKKWVSDERFDLFLITPEPELNEFEQEVKGCVIKNLTTHIKDGNGREMSRIVFIDDETAKKMTAELLDLARKEVLNDLPRWKKIKEVTTKRTEDDDCVTTETLLVKGWMYSDDYRIIEPNCMVNREMLCIPVRLLYKLPGFKED